MIAQAEVMYSAGERERRTDFRYALLKWFNRVTLCTKCKPGLLTALDITA